MARILVIDDDTEMRAMLEQTLRSAGHEVALAEDGKQGVALYRAQPAALVLTDLFMPNREGLETIIELRKDYPGILIIAMCGKPGAGGLLSIAQRLGAARVIQKPFHPHELLQAVEEVLP
jgi:CheY-like chemotaxis protein